ncbi:MAG: MerR family transcriptional regulator [Geminicoccaceae bacterium]
MASAVDVVIEGRTGDDAPRPPKSSTAFRTISEVADDLAVAQHVLRFWESKFPQVRPLKRGGGRRYYRPEDVDLLRQIRSLLYEEGYTIKGAQKLLRARRGRGTGAERVEPKAPTRAKREGVADPVVREALSELRADLVDLRDLLERLRSGTDEDED